MATTRAAALVAVLLTATAVPAASARPAARRIALTGRIAFVAGDMVPQRTKRLPGIYVMRADGTGLRRLTRSHPQGVSPRGSYDVLPAWSPDGRSIAFVRDTLTASGDNWNVFVVNATGGGLRRLVPNAQAIAWAPTGRIAFVRLEQDRITGQSADALYVANAAGGGEHRIATAPNLYSPAWSPDGRRIAYAGTERDANGEVGNAFLAVMNADGTDVRKLIENGSWPSWSPDGRRIAFVRLVVGHDVADTWVIGASGGGARRMIRGGEHPSWSPDGKRLVVAGQRHLASAFGSIQYDTLYVVNADGTKRTLLDPFGLQARAGSSQPTWHR